MQPAGMSRSCFRHDRGPNSRGGDGVRATGANAIGDAARLIEHDHGTDVMIAKNAAQEAALCSSWGWRASLAARGAIEAKR